MPETVTAAMLETWFREAPKGATHMIVAVDEIDWSSYPVYVSEGEDVRKRHKEEHAKPLQRVMEVYRLDYSFQKQVSQHRCCTYDLPLDGYDDHVSKAVSALHESSLDAGVLTGAEQTVIIGAERARRQAVARAKDEAEATARYEQTKRLERMAAAMATSDTHPARADGEAVGPSPIDATRTLDGESTPPAPTASPSISLAVEGVDARVLEQLRDIDARGHAPEEVRTALRVALRYYDLAVAAWQGCRQEFTELRDNTLGGSS